MSLSPQQQQQILIAHAGLIRRIAQAVLQPGTVADLEHILQVSADNGWSDLVAAIRRVLAGSRGEDALLGLDDEDRVIVGAILHAIEHPETLEQAPAQPGAGMAASALANMIHAARDNPQAREMLNAMVGQMSQVDGDMAILGAHLDALLDGERDPAVLGANMSERGQALMAAIVDQLGRLEPDS